MALVCNDDEVAIAADGTLRLDSPQDYVNVLRRLAETAQHIAYGGELHETAQQILEAASWNTDEAINDAASRVLAIAASCTDESVQNMAVQVYQRATEECRSKLDDQFQELSRLMAQNEKSCVAYVNGILDRCNRAAMAQASKIALDIKIAEQTAKNFASQEASAAFQEMMTQLTLSHDSQTSTTTAVEKRMVVRIRAIADEVARVTKALTGRIEDIELSTTKSEVQVEELKSAIRQALNALGLASKQSEGLNATLRRRIDCEAERLQEEIARAASHMDCQYDLIAREVSNERRLNCSAFQRLRKSLERVDAYGQNSMNELWRRVEMLENASPRTKDPEVTARIDRLAATVHEEKGLAKQTADKAARDAAATMMRLDKLEQAVAEGKNAVAGINLQLQEITALLRDAQGSRENPINVTQDATPQPKKKAPKKDKPQKSTTRRIVLDSDDEVDESSEDSDDTSVLEDSPQRTSTKMSFIARMHRVTELTFSEEENFARLQRLRSEMDSAVRSNRDRYFVTNRDNLLGDFAQWQETALVVGASGRTQALLERGAKIVWQMRATIAHFSGTADYKGLMAFYDANQAAYPSAADFAKALTKTAKPRPKPRSEAPKKNEDAKPQDKVDKTKTTKGKKSKNDSDTE